MDVEILLDIGFIDIGSWKPSGDVIKYELEGVNQASNMVLLEKPAALYAFVHDSAVCYIGKTARSIRRRFIGYCRPGNTQATNRRCHCNIKSAINQGKEIRILIFTPILDLAYAEFQIDLAAGLEDSLIRKFNPPWNGGNKTRRMSESAEREEEGDNNKEKQDDESFITPDSSIENKLFTKVLNTFSINLGGTYYRTGYLNPGIEASSFLGKDGEPIRVIFNNDSDPVISKINRTANRNGSVRVVGNNQLIARWFQENFNEGDVVCGEVVDSHTIRLKKLAV